MYCNKMLRGEMCRKTKFKGKKGDVVVNKNTQGAFKEGRPSERA